MAGAAFISPWIVGFLVFTLWPVLYSGYLSLTDYDVINAPTFVGLANYAQLWNDPKVALSLKNTLFYTVLSVPLHLIVALFLAMLLNQAGRATGFFRTAFFLPKMTPPVAVGVLLLLLFNGQSGLLNQVLGLVRRQRPVVDHRPDLGQAGADPDEPVDRRVVGDHPPGGAARRAPGALRRGHGRRRRTRGSGRGGSPSR